MRKRQRLLFGRLIALLLVLFTVIILLIAVFMAPSAQSRIDAIIGVMSSLGVLTSVVVGLAISSD